VDSSIDWKCYINLTNNESVRHHQRIKTLRGRGHVAICLEKKVKANGIEFHILSTGNQVSDYADVLRDAGYRIRQIPFRKSGRFFIDIRKLIRSERYMAVHIHTEWAFIWYVLTARLAGIPMGSVRRYCPT